MTIKTGAEIRHEAKDRVKRYRAQMIEKGYISTTIFLSGDHRAELKRLGDEHRLTRAEAAEHIFKAYLQSLENTGDHSDKNITQTHNTNTDQMAETHAIIESLEHRIEALEKKAENQAENNHTPCTVNPLAGDLGNGQAIDLQAPVEPDPLCETIGETKATLPDWLKDIGTKNMPIEQRDKIVLRLKDEFPERSKAIAQKRIDILNAAGVTLRGQAWTRTKQFTDQLNQARRRQKEGK